MISPTDRIRVRARAVVELMAAKVIDGSDPEVVEACCRTLGLSLTSLQVALDELERTRTRRVTKDVRKTIEDRRHPEMAPKQPRTTKVRTVRVVDGERMLRCNGGPGYADPHWAPEVHFSKRTDHGGRRSACDECQRGAQRLRRLDVKKRAALAEVGLEFVVADGDDVAGLVCKDCGQEIVPGERVHVEGVAYHWECAPVDELSGDGDE